MKKLVMCCLMLLPLLLSGAVWEDSPYWPQWRGPEANGVAPGADPPLRWDENHNIAWKTEIPGKGSSTPVIWDQKIFVSTATAVGDPVQKEVEEPAGGEQRGPRGLTADHVQQFMLLALDRKTGRTLWKKVLREELPHEGTHPTGTWASGSPITDGKHVYAYFGSRGLYCLDMDGNLIWEKDLGDMQIRLGFGEGSSPALAGDRLVINWDHEGQSFTVALDKNTGQEIWRTSRDEITSWSSPLILEHQGRTQVVTSATNRVRSYDLKTGALIWQTEGMTLNAIPTPVAGNDLVFVTSGFRGNALLAIRLDKAQGDITGSDVIAWSLDRDTPYTPSPLLYKGILYILKSNNGILSTFEAVTGKRHYGPVRLDDVPNVYASPVGAADRVYIAGREGTTAVIAQGPEFKVLAVNTLDDGFDASPAVVDKEIYLRGKRYLYRISE